MSYNPNTSNITNGTATDAGTLNGAETVPVSRGIGLLQTTWNTAAGFISSTFGWALTPLALSVNRTISARFSDLPVSINEFYQPGYTDDQALTAALAYCSANKKDLRIPKKSTSYVITTPKIWDHHSHGIICETGVRMYCTGITGYAFTVQSLFSDASGSQNAFRHYFEGPEIFGDKQSGKHAFFFGDPSGTTYTSLLACMRNMAIHDFDQIMNFGNNAAQMSFTNISHWSSLSGIQYPTGLANSGENIVFDTVQGLNSTSLMTIAGNGDFNLINCSLDYFNTYAISVSGGGRVTISGGHCEFSSDGDVAFKTSGAGSTIVFTGAPMRFMITATSGSPRTNYLFNGGNSDGGIIVRDCSINAQVAGNYVPQSFGTGYCWIQNQTVLSIGTSTNQYDFARLSRSTAQNLLLDPGFEDTSNFSWNLVDWHFVNTNNTMFGTDTSTFHSGTRSLKIKPTSGTSFRMQSRTVPCGPGQMPILSGWMKNSISNATDKLTITASYFDNSGQSQLTVISSPTSSFQWNQSNANAAFTLFNWCPFTPAPAGTAYAMFSFTGGSTDGLTTHWLDDMILDVVNVGQPGQQFGATRNFTFGPQVQGSTTGGTMSGANVYARGELIGQRFFFSIVISWTGHSGTGNIFVAGLPYLPDYGGGTSTNGDVPCTIGAIGIPITAGNILQAHVTQQSQNITVSQLNPSTGVETAVALPTSGTIRLAGHYDIF